MRKTFPIFVLVACTAGAPAQAGGEQAVREQLARQVQGQGQAAAPRGHAALRSLIAMLDQPGSGSPDSKARKELERLGPVASPALTESLRELGPLGRRTALDLLCEHPIPALYERLAEMLRGADVDQFQAAGVLGNLRSRETRALRDIARASKLASVRLAGLRAAARAGDEADRILADLQEFIDLEHHSSASRDVVDVLAKLTDSPAARALLLRYARELDSEEAAEAWVEGCRTVDEAMTGLAAMTGYRARKGAFDAAWHRDDRKAFAPVLLAAVHEGTREPEVLLQFCAANGIAIPEAALRRILTNSGEGVVLATCKYIGASQDARLAKLAGEFVVRDDMGLNYKEPLLRLLVERDREELFARAEALLRSAIAEEAARAFARAPDPRVVPIAVKRIREQPNDWAAAPPLLEAVAQGASADQFAHLIELARVADNGDEIGERSLAAARAMERWFGPAHVTPALRALPDVAPDARGLLFDLAAGHAEPDHAEELARAVRMFARQWTTYGGTEMLRRGIELLGQLGGDAARRCLDELLQSDTGAVREMAFAACGRLLDDDARTAWLLALLDTAAGRERFLPHVLEHPDAPRVPRLREAVAAALASWRGAQLNTHGFLVGCPASERARIAMAILEHARREGPELGWLAPNALHALGKDREVAHVPELAKWLNHDSSVVRHAAIEQLGRTFSMPAIPHLVEALKDDDEANAEVAARWLARLEKYIESQGRWNLGQKKSAADKGK